MAVIIAKLFLVSNFAPCCSLPSQGRHHTDSSNLLAPLLLSEADFFLSVSKRKCAQSIFICAFKIKYHVKVRWGILQCFQGSMPRLLRWKKIFFLNILFRTNLNFDISMYIFETSCCTVLDWNLCCAAPWVHNFLLYSSKPNQTLALNVNFVLYNSWLDQLQIP